MTEEHKLKISVGGKGQKRSAETCANLSKALKGNPNLRKPRKPVSEEAKRNIALARIGKKHTDEAKANMRAAALRRASRELNNI